MAPTEGDTAAAGGADMTVLDSITVTGVLLNSEGHPLGGRRVVATPRPLKTIEVGGEAVSLVADAITVWATGAFTLTVIKSPGTIYSIQTQPEWRLPSGIELRCNDYPDGTVLTLAELPVIIPPVIPPMTVAELEAELYAYIQANMRQQLMFSDIRLSVTVGPGDMAYPNEMGRPLSIVAVGVDAKLIPTGADLVLDVNTNGTTIFTDQSHRPRIPAGGSSGGATVIDRPVFAPNDVLTVDVDEIGTVTAGGHLTVTVVVQG